MPLWQWLLRWTAQSQREGEEGQEEAGDTLRCVYEAERTGQRAPSESLPAVPHGQPFWPHRKETF